MRASSYDCAANPRLSADVVVFAWCTVWCGVDIAKRRRRRRPSVQRYR